jgi:hypothetical protein
VTGSEIKDPTFHLTWPAVFYKSRPLARILAVPGIMTKHGMAKFPHNFLNILSTRIMRRLR